MHAQGLKWLAVPAVVLTLTLPAATQGGADALKNLTVDKSASPELVGHLAKELSITPGQAQGASGALLGLAKSRLSPAEFGEISKAIPGVDGLLKAAPMLGSVGGSQLAGLAGLAGSFKQLGLDPGLVAKAVPALTAFVSGKGGTNAAKLLANVLK